MLVLACTKATKVQVYMLDKTLKPACPQEFTQGLIKYQLLVLLLL